jgi:hypothetical protein
VLKDESVLRERIGDETTLDALENVEEISDDVLFFDYL